MLGVLPVGYRKLNLSLRAPPVTQEMDNNRSAVFLLGTKSVGENTKRLRRKEDVY